MGSADRLRIIAQYFCRSILKRSRQKCIGIYIGTVFNPQGLAFLLFANITTRHRGYEHEMNGMEWGGAYF